MAHDNKAIPAKNHNPRHVLLILSLLALGGTLILLAATARGIGLSPDSAYYIGAARSLVRGRGLVAPFGDPQRQAMTHFAPLFPAVLALFGKTGIDPLEAARWLNSFLFGLHVLLAGLIVRRYAPASFWAPILGSFLMLTSVIALWVHSWAWSEPLFILLGLSGLWLLAEHLERPRPSFLVGASGLISLAWLTRYPGVALVVTGFVGIFLFSPERPLAKFRDCALFFGLGSLPIFLWICRNYLAAGSATNRELVFHSIRFANLAFGLGSVSEWVLPHGTSTLAGAVVLFGLTAFMVIAGTIVWSRERRCAGGPLYAAHLMPFLLVIFILAYFAVVILSMLFLDANITLDNRILAPIYVSTLFVLLCWGYRLFAESGRRSVTSVIPIVCIVFAAISTGRAAYAITYTRSQGLGYASVAWRSSVMMQEIKELPRGLTVFTNAPAAVYSVTGRASLPIPGKVDLYTLRVNENYGNELVEMRQHLATGAALLAYFNSSSWYLPSEKELREQLQLQPVRIFPEGAFYTATY
ncbi:MAG: hypothetical protein Kow0099_32030 [Candidatus Abyssubacteria bacterium]